MGALDPLFVLLTRIGTAGAVWIAIACALALAWRRRTILWAIPVLWLADLTAYEIKLAVDRPRPRLEHLVRVPTDPSFPSGHAATSFAGATLLSWLAPRLAPWLALLAVAISYSRLYVGVHYPLDVLGGAALGTAFGALAITALRRRARGPRRSRAGPPAG